MNAKSTMQMINLGLSIFNKVQTMQHRQIRMANDMKRSQLPRATRGSRHSNKSITDAEIISQEVDDSI